MMQLSIVSPRKASRIIRETPIQIRQGFTRPYDFISAINFGEQVIQPVPTLYYSVKESDKHYYIFYGIYHYKDFSHRHDFEGVLLRKEKGSGFGHQSILITRNHYHLFFYEIWRNYDGFIRVRIEANRHGIDIVEKYGKGDKDNYIYYHNFDFQNMYLKRHQKKWDKFFEQTKNVQAPWEWKDIKMENYIKKHRRKVLKKYGIKTMTGLIWNDPDKLIEIANDMGYIYPR